MLQEVINFLANWPPELATAFLSMIPIAELRVGIPTAVFGWQLPAMTALFWAVLGNCLPIVPLYFGLERFRSFAAVHIPFLVRPIDHALGRGEQKLKEQYGRYGAFALFLFTAIPLPLTGAWTATAAAVALKIPFKYAGPAIALGVLTAGIIVVIISGALTSFI